MSAKTHPASKIRTGWIDKEIVEQLRIEYGKGATFAELSSKFNINIGTLKSRAHRDGWQARRTELKEASRKSASQFVQETAAKMAHDAVDLIHEVIDDMRLAMEKIRKLLKAEELKAKDCPDLLNAYKIAVGLRRQALGLSDEVKDSGTKSVVNVQVVTHGTAGAKLATGGSDIPMSNPIDLPIGKA